MRNWITILLRAIASGSIGYCTVYYGLTFIRNQKLKKMHYKLLRENVDEFVTIDRIPECKDEIIACKLFDTGLKKEVMEVVENFISTLKERPYIDRTNFYRNFHDQCIKVDTSKKTENIGIYNVYQRQITLFTDDLTDALIHELLHMASSYIDGDISACGFNRHNEKNNSGSIGEGLNEGYTALLENRHFQKNYMYYTLRIISDMIEHLVGRERMESLYFKGDLFGLIGSLSAYGSKESILRLIRKMDMYHELVYGKFNYSKTKINSMVTDILKDVCTLYQNAIIKDTSDDLDKLDYHKNALNTIIDIAREFQSDDEYLDFCESLNLDWHDFYEENLQEKKVS